MKADHLLKILPEYYYSVKSGSKTFEIRKNDRNYKIGDLICLNLFNDGKFIDGEAILIKIKYLTDYKQRDGYVVFSFDIIENYFKGF